MSAPVKEAPVTATKAAGLTDRESEILFKAWKCLKSFPEVDYDKLCAECDLSTRKNAGNQWLKIKKKLFPDGIPASMATTIEISSLKTPGRKRKAAAGVSVPAPPSPKGHSTPDKNKNVEVDKTVTDTPARGASAGAAAGGSGRAQSAPAGNGASPASVGGRAVSVPVGNGTAAFTSASTAPVANPFHVPAGGGGPLSVPTGNGTSAFTAPIANPFSVSAGSGGPFLAPTSNGRAAFSPAAGGGTFLGRAAGDGAFPVSAGGGTALFGPVGSGGSVSEPPIPSAADRAAAASIMAAVRRIPGLGNHPLEAYLPSSAPVSPAKFSTPVRTPVTPVHARTIEESLEIAKIKTQLAQNNPAVFSDVPPTPARVCNAADVDSNAADMGSAAKRHRGDQGVPETPKVAVPGIAIVSATQGTPDTPGASAPPDTPKTPKSQQMPKVPKTPRSPKTPKRPKAPRLSKKTPFPAEVVQTSPSIPSNKGAELVSAEEVYALIQELAANEPKDTAVAGTLGTPSTGAAAGLCGVPGVPASANMTQDQTDTAIVNQPVVNTGVPAAAANAGVAHTATAGVNKAVDSAL